MRILVDADACPVVEQVESVARWHRVPVTLLCDTNHVLVSDYSNIMIVSTGKDAVDYVLANLCQAGDVVVTQDRGVAAMALGKSAFAIHQDGWQYVDNIKNGCSSLQRLNWRHFHKARKRTEEDNATFLANFDMLLAKIAEDKEEHAWRLWAASIVDSENDGEESRQMA